jgi:hypothetical protein
MWIEMLKSKDQALDSFKKIVARAENESGGKLKALRTDRGGEFNSNLFSVFCSEGGVKHYTTTPYTPQQNGVVERRNQSVIEMARCLLKAMKVPSVFWGEAVRIAVYLLNRSSTKALDNMTPFEAWHGKKPKVNHLKVFGCLAHVKVVGPNVNKLSGRSKKMIFIGYESGTKGYRLFDPTTNSLVISRDVVFEENVTWDWDNTRYSADRQVIDTFTVQYELTNQNLTTAAEAKNANSQNAGTGAEAKIPADQRGDMVHNGGPNTPITPGSNAGQAIQYATPPSQHSEDTFGGPLRFRTLNDLLDSTDEMQDYEYSGVCLLAVDEPSRVDDALEKDC